MPVLDAQLPATSRVFAQKHKKILGENNRKYSSTGCSLNIVFLPRILEILPPLPRQHLAAIGCTKKLPANRSESLKVSYSDLGEGGVAVNCEKKTQFFLNTLYVRPLQRLHGPI